MPLWWLAVPVALAAEPVRVEAEWSGRTYLPSRTPGGPPELPPPRVIRDLASFKELVSTIPTREITPTQPAPASNDPLLRRPRIDFDRSAVIVAFRDDMYQGPRIGPVVARDDGTVEVAITYPPLGDAVGAAAQVGVGTYHAIQVPAFKGAVVWKDERAEAAVNSVLDALHASAAAADEPTYFGLFTDDAVFLGTDATERWTLEAFRKFAAPHFAEPPAWVYEPIVRHVAFDADARVAWFDEALRSASYGEARGSGVLVARDSGWKIAQYVLSFPVPNDLAAELASRAAEHAAERLPTPFGAAEIAAAWVPGTVIEMRIREGSAQSRQRWTVVANEGERGTTRFEDLNRAGAVVSSREATAAFAELRDHASFPRALTETGAELLQTPLGPLYCRRYDVRDPADQTRHTRFWFSLAHPGPPILMQVFAGENLVYEMAQTSRKAPTAAR